MSTIQTGPEGLPRLSRELLGRSIAGTMLMGLAAFSISACTTPPDNAGRSTQVAACSWLEGYPDCRPGHASETVRNSYASAQPTSRS